MQEAERTRSESGRQKKLYDRSEHRKNYSRLSWGQKKQEERATVRASMEKIFGDWENQGELLLNKDLHERARCES